MFRLSISIGSGKLYSRSQLLHYRNTAKLPQRVFEAVGDPGDNNRDRLRLQIGLSCAQNIGRSDCVDALSEMNNVVAAQPIRFDVEYDPRRSLRGFEPLSHCRY